MDNNYVKYLDNHNKKTFKYFSLLPKNNVKILNENEKFKIKQNKESFLNKTDFFKKITHLTKNSLNNKTRNNKLVIKNIEKKTDNDARFSMPLNLNKTINKNTNFKSYSNLSTVFKQIKSNSVNLKSNSTGNKINDEFKEKLTNIITNKISNIIDKNKKINCILDSPLFGIQYLDNKNNSCNSIKNNLLINSKNSEKFEYYYKNNQNNKIKNIYTSKIFKKIDKYNYLFKKTPTNLSNPLKNISKKCGLSCPKLRKIIDYSLSLEKKKINKLLKGCLTGEKLKDNKHFDYILQKFDVVNNPFYVSKNDSLIFDSIKSEESLNISKNYKSKHYLKSKNIL